jgi:uncharacterized repeat protein (TIGR03837 family)
MAAGLAPVWIDLEYLSAEDYVERQHGLPSPQSSGPGRGFTKWFFYPGFTRATGGLLREADLCSEQQGFDRDVWLAQRCGIEARPGERIVSLFCYDNPVLPALIDALADAPTLLLATPGSPTRQVQSHLGGSGRRGLRWVALPWLSQRDYDRLLWSCDLNFVRGEDSFVRAQWAGAPFVWQIYPQADAVHAVKLDAFLQRLQSAAPLPSEVLRLFRRWSGTSADTAPVVIPSLAVWHTAALQWRAHLLEQDDLTTQIVRFVREKHARTAPERR